MKKLQIQTNPKVELVFNKYPAPVRKKLLDLRRLIIESAEEATEITNLEETLKWGEPSYLVKKGSTIRINRKKNDPNTYAMYFQCTSKLVATFRVVYHKVFTFEGNRAIVFQMDEKLPEIELKNCITAALKYHSVKQFPMLGL